ncbi:MRN complex-interacting protein isoform X1 [Misgurnus anguillicaudatus]|uniref:MRN complex-interacting protein isoform X1 n=1 Tax=Misgurnus anguillicaudatus TaxID=75329 RepID=UPI003CCF47F5
MVQEFHVLRCFSCQTFQVQQVKKSKKWECKVCGEKQSVLKEYGRGAAADCRRHVQKLNSLRGELLEVNREKVLSQWEHDKDDQNASVNEDLDAHHESEEVPTVSRWSKYIDRTSEDPKQEEDEKEEENIYMERETFRNRGPRKRKLVSKLNSVDSPSGNFEHDESWTGCLDVKRRSYQPSQPDRKLSSSRSNGHFSKYSHQDNAKDVSSPSTHLPSSPPAVSSYHTAATGYTYTAGNSKNCQQNSSHTQPGADVPKHLPLPNRVISAPSSNRTSESKLGSTASKWNKFLTVVPTQEEEDDGVDDNLSTVVPESTDIHYQELRSPLVGKTEVGRQMSVGDVCMDGNFHSRVFSSEQAVCQPPLTKKSCPGLSLNSLFFTDEDFDDTF